MLNEQKIINRNNNQVIIKNKNTILFNLLFLLNLLLVNQLYSINEPNPTTDRIKTHIVTLSSDEMEGRYPASMGGQKAAEYIQNIFKQYGLKPISNSFLQVFPFLTGLQIHESSEVSFTKLIEKPGVPKDLWRKSEIKWKLIDDWKPMRFSESGTITAEIAFVGLGITAKDKNYDDYEGIDVKDKIVIILSDSSENKAQDNFLSDFKDLRYKVTNAREHGALGIIFIKKLSDSANTYYSFKVDKFNKNSGIIAIQANRTSISKFFTNNNNLYPSEMEIYKKKKPKSFIIPNTTVTISVKIENEEKQIPNIIGYVAGTNPSKADEYLVVGAHFDHLGKDEDTKSKTPLVYNGADDNASGVAGMLELAYRISKNPLQRPVIFIGFNAEEEGLLGSAYYANNPLLPIEKHVFMLNLDMIGRMKDNKISISGTGSSSNFISIIDSIAAIDSLTTTKLLEAFSPSDNSSFYAKKIPVLFFFTGVHSDYHKYSDDWDKINFIGETKIIDFSEKVLYTIGNAQSKPDYQEIIDTNANKKMMMRSSNSPWFGIVPNFEDNPKGMLISGTSAGSPAQKAGLKDGDIIISFAGKTIKNLYDLTYALNEKKPGDNIVVVYIRNNKEIKVKITLAKK